MFPIYKFRNGIKYIVAHMCVYNISCCICIEMIIGELISDGE